VAHEEALWDISAAEIAGDRAGSLQPIMALAHMRRRGFGRPLPEVAEVAQAEDLLSRPIRSGCGLA
jgi:hypothetical protein